MLRLSIAAGLSLLGIVLPIARGSRPAAEQKPVIPPNAVGTWRLDSLLDQAVITGVAAGSLDPASFVLHELAFDGDLGAIVPLSTTLGEAKVSQGEGGARLSVKGQAGAFLLKLPKTKLANIGAYAWKVRSTDCSEVALVRDRETVDRIKGMVAGPGGPGFGRFGGGVEERVDLLVGQHLDLERCTIVGSQFVAGGKGKEDVTTAVVTITTHSG